MLGDRGTKPRTPWTINQWPNHWATEVSISWWLMTARQTCMVMDRRFLNHWLVKVRLNRASVPASRMTYTYRNFKLFDIMAFRNFKRQSVSMMSPWMDPADASTQLYTDVIMAIDCFALLCNQKRQREPMVATSSEINSNRKTPTQMLIF